MKNKKRIKYKQIVITMAKAKILKATTRGRMGLKGKGKGLGKGKASSRPGAGAPKPTWAKYLMTIIVVALIAFTVFYIIQLSRSSFGGGARKEGYADPTKVVLLHSDTCPHCKDFLPVFEEAQRDPQFASVVFEETETRSDKAKQYLGSLSGVPTVLVLGQDGTPVTSLVGKRTLEVFKKELKDAIASPPQA